MFVTILLYFFCRKISFIQLKKWTYLDKGSTTFTRKPIFLYILVRFLQALSQYSLLYQVSTISSVLFLQSHLFGFFNWGVCFFVLFCFLFYVHIAVLCLFYLVNVPSFMWNLCLFVFSLYLLFWLLHVLLCVCVCLSVCFPCLVFIPGIYSFDRIRLP